jgi:hypothetical protein
MINLLGVGCHFKIYILFICFRADESQSTLPGSAILSSKNTRINSKKANYEKKHLPSKITTKPNKIRDANNFSAGNIIMNLSGKRREASRLYE